MYVRISAYWNIGLYLQDQNSEIEGAKLSYKAPLVKILLKWCSHPTIKMTLIVIFEPLVTKNDYSFWVIPSH